MNPTVICTNLSLTELPNFETSDDPFKTYPSGGSFYAQKILYFDDNQITAIPEGAFAALGELYPTGNLTIDLSFNSISEIDDNAFSGLDNTTINLKLRGNQLTSIPSAFVNIANLASLDISLNPLKTVDNDILSKLAPTLNQFFVSLDYVEEMPKAMGSLQTLLLSIDGLRETELQEKVQADDHTETLQELFISNSSLKDLSVIPCRFPNLLHLHLEENYNLSPDLFGKCSTAENLTLNSLEIEKCNLTSVEVSMYNAVVYLSFRYNSLQSVPPSVLNLPEVWMIDLAYNQIERIGAGDFNGLRALADVVLDGNPLTTISDGAFATNKLSYLSLRNTRLTSIPAAVTVLPRIYSLSLPDSTIECSCSSMAHLNGWQMGYNNARCKNDPETSIYKYIQSDLPLCNQ